MTPTSLLNQRISLIGRAKACQNGEILVFYRMSLDCRHISTLPPLLFRLGVKNKMTREQVFFNCNICECELKSVVTLRAHCRGTQHVRKALQKKKVLKHSKST